MVREPEHHTQLQMEFELYLDAQKTEFTRPVPGHFIIPKARQYWGPETAELQPLPSRSASKPYLRWYQFPLPEGKFSPPITTHLQEGLKSDPPLDLTRYKRFSEAMKDDLGLDLPSLDQITTSMGHLLAQLHWSMGINARDVELVLGGDGFHGVKCHALDSNQCQRWLVPGALRAMSTTQLIRSPMAGAYATDDLRSGAIRLARLIFSQELYYPRPHQRGLYEPFKVGYLAAVKTILP
nr:uncharacterized protein CI109_001292 [Kwoniella shandongensis]KAA5530488.1 hypothetical protein CI109_001292 [Kwoniella shandongensis]